MSTEFPVSRALTAVIAGQVLELRQSVEDTPPLGEPPPVFPLPELGAGCRRTPAYEAVFLTRPVLVIAGSASGAIANAGLVKSTAAYARVLRAPVRTSQGGGAPSGGSGGSTGFITASGKNACRAEGGGVYCSSNTSYAVYMGSSGPWEPVSANPPSALSSSILGYGTTWRTPDGLISCVVQASGATGVYCSNVAGFGFRLWDGGLTNG